MTATQIQNLNIGDKVKYCGFPVEIVDWKCHKDLVMLGNERIWAEPIFRKADGSKFSIHPAYWKEISV